LDVEFCGPQATKTDWVEPDDDEEDESGSEEDDNYMDDDGHKVGTLQLK
jgi:hypothetical protein